jgi:hypothetical protein
MPTIFCIAPIARRTHRGLTMVPAVRPQDGARPEDGAADCGKAKGILFQPRLAPGLPPNINNMD